MHHRRGLANAAESAIGALLRCDQTVVVGDTNQLPPSSFFKTMVNDEEADEDETVLNESVLEMANATFRPARRLRWHYRSQHSGLIKFSNRLVYEDNLMVFPSATESMSRMGIEFRPVAGRYKAGTNPVEAKAMVEAALEFMRSDPNRSLGIVTLNQKQMETDPARNSNTPSETTATLSTTSKPGRRGTTDWKNSS